jgi:TolB-like protein/DNA-binding winged helix-turn-helix (wHTH) protein/Tfp pilus assembly protein PilF
MVTEVHHAEPNQAPGTQLSRHEKRRLPNQAKVQYCSLNLFVDLKGAPCMDLSPPSTLFFANAEFEQLTGTLTVAGRSSRLRPQTAAVLAHLLAHRGQVVSKEALLQAVWSDLVVTENSLSQCLSEIRRALGDSADVLLETIPRRGYLIRPEVTSARPAPAAMQPPAPVAMPDPAPLGRAPSRRNPRWLLGAMAAILVVGALWLVWHNVIRNTVNSPGDPLTLAVLPFETRSSDADLAWFGEVLGEDLTFNLARIPGARLVSRVSTQAYPATGVDVRTIGKELGVRYLVGGSVRREGDQMVLNLHLSDTQTGQQHWAERFATSVAELPRTEHWAAQRIAQSLHLELINTFAHQTEQLTGPQLDAHTLGLQAWAAWNRDTPKDAERAKSLALQALSLDERSLLALKTMASWHLRARINQSMPADQALAGAESYARRAMAIDPSHPLVNTVMGGALALRGQYESANRHLKQEIETNPSHPVAYYFLGLSHLMQGEPGQAQKVYEQLVTISPRDTRLSRYYRNLAIAYLHQGQLEPALQFARAATETPQPFPNAWAALASVCALTGDTTCSQTALARFLSIRPGFDISKVEAEWPPASAGFTTQHAKFLRGLRLAGLPDKVQGP